MLSSVMGRIVHNTESVYLDQEVLGIECITSRFGRHWLSRTVQM